MEPVLMNQRMEIPNATAHPNSFTTQLREQSDLTGPKLGLAAVMFVYVNIACTMPLIIINCMGNSSHSRSSLQSHESSNSGITPVTKPPRNTWLISQWTKCKRWASSRQEKLIGRLNCLAAGALLSVGFLDVFMDTMESVEEALNKLNVHSGFPLASFITLIGFLLIVGVEQLTLEYYHAPHQQSSKAKKDETRDYRGATISRKDSSRASIRDRATSLTGMSEAITVAPETIDPIVTEDLDVERQNANCEEGHSHVNTANFINSGWIRVMILLFAISLHSIFEGMALGLCDSLTSLLTLFGALSLHKLIIAVSIGINLAAETSTQGCSSGNRRRLFIYQALAILTFAGASPLGALIGWAVTNQTDSVGFLLSQAVLQGLACGTFCYVVFCELLPREMQEEKEDKAGKFFFLVWGFALITFVIAFAPDGE